LSEATPNFAATASWHPGILLFQQIDGPATSYQLDSGFKFVVPKKLDLLRKANCIQF